MSGDAYNGNAKLNVNVGQTGVQYVTVTASYWGSNDWGSIPSPSYNSITVICSYSAALRTAGEKLGVTFSNSNTVYNIDNINVFPENLDKFEDIIEAKALYDNLNSCEKALIDSWISTKSSYSNFTALYNAANAYLTSLANAFVTTDLQNETVATRTNYETIINANTAWTNLKTIVKNKVISDFVNYPDLLISAEAYKFIDTYNVDNSNNAQLTKEVDKLILTSYPDAWNELSNDVQARVWSLIENTNAVKGAVTSAGVTNFAEWIEYVQNDLDLRYAEEFVNRNNLSNFDLTKFEVNNNIDIVNEGNSELAESIVGAVSEDYDSLNDNAKAKTATDTDMGTSFETIKSAAQNYLDSLSARSFINDNKLKTAYPETVEALTLDEINELEEIAKNIVGLNGAFDELTEQVKEKVLNELNVTSFQDVIDNSQNYLDDLESARKFIEDNKLDQTMTNEIAEAILDLAEENAFDTLSERAKSIVELMLGKTFNEVVDEADEFLEKSSDDFISDNNLMSVVNSDIGKEMIAERKTVMLLSRGLSQEAQDSDELTKEIAENAVALDDDFSDLTPRVQERVLAKLGVANAGGFDTVGDIAQEFLDETEANEFIEDNKLDEDLTKQTASNIVGLADDFEKLSNDNVKEKVLGKLGVEDFEEVIEEAQEFLDNVAAKEFYDNYLDGLDEEKIVAGKDAWDNSSETVQGKINKLLNDNNVKETYPELYAKAKDALEEKAAQDFINNYLTKDSEVIKEALASNAKQIIDAEDAYKLLSDEVKERVNTKLTEVANTTYPKLLEAAQDLIKNPKTGDLSGIMIIVLVVSILGIVITKRKRK